MDLSIIHTSPFYELTALVALAAVAGFVGLLLRQPMIVSFIAVGVLAGPSVLNIVQSHQNIELLSELGVAVLLFLVGLKLDVQLVRTLGRVAVATGLGQVLFTSAFGFLIGLALGLDAIEALYVAVALTFSSTIIIVKLLSDKKEVDALHGRIAIGFLIVQDLFVVVAMMVLSAFGIGTQSEASILGQIGAVFLYGMIMLAFVAFFIRYAANRLVGRIAHSPELLVTFSIGWAALLAALGDHFGFSKELGGLLAGVSLASTPFREAIVARLASLRDFLLLFFFIALGAKLDLRMLGDQLLPAIVFSVFVLVGNPLIVMAIMRYMGYRKRTGFLAGLTVAQISEFSLIFIAMGMTLGHVNAEALGLVTMVGLVTIALSVYMITYSHQLFKWLEPWLGAFERAGEKGIVFDDTADDRQYDVILFGMGRYGSAIAQHLKKDGVRLLVVDFNPDEVRRWAAAGFETVYGDACDHEFIGSLPLRRLKWVISAMPQHDQGVRGNDVRLMLIEGLHHHRCTARIAVSAEKPAEEAMLRKKGASLVLFPFQDAAQCAAEKIRQSE